MRFLQAAFINKNTSELRKRLEELGYKPCYQMVLHPDDNNNLFVDNIFSDSYYSFDKENMTIFKDDINTAIREKRLVECSDNEDLFLAIVALRNDTDKNQWFIMDVEIYSNMHQGDWFLATDRNGGKHIGTQIDPMYCHKATVEELIEHFKKVE